MVGLIILATLGFIISIVNIIMFRRFKTLVELSITQTLKIVNELHIAGTKLDNLLLDLCRAETESVRILNERVTSLEKNRKSGLTLGDVIGDPN